VRIGELARRAGVSIKTVRYYERLGLIEASRSANGYRVFDEGDVRAVSEIKSLVEAGVAASLAAPFLECLGLGHERRR
jgi:DNA-binding transcriptional MerR regulator